MNYCDLAPAYIRAIAAGENLPEWHWDFTTQDGFLTLTLTSATSARMAKLWVAHSEDKDFRPSDWQALPMRAEAEGTRFLGKIALPEQGYLAAFGEITFAGKSGEVYTLSTQPHIAEKSPR